MAVPTGGTFTLRLTFPGDVRTTGAITYTTNTSTLQSNIQNALNATFGTGNTVVSAGSNSQVTITFTGGLAGLNLGAIEIPNSSLTGGTSPSVTPSTLIDAGLRSTISGSAINVSTGQHSVHGHCGGQQ